MSAAAADKTPEGSSAASSGEPCVSPAGQARLASGGSAASGGNATPPSDNAAASGLGSTASSSGSAASGVGSVASDGDPAASGVNSTPPSGNATPPSADAVASNKDPTASKLNAAAPKPDSAGVSGAGDGCGGRTDAGVHPNAAGVAGAGDGSKASREAPSNKDAAAPKPAAAGVSGEKMTLNMGPSHPATHGVLRLELELDGDVILACTPVIGYLHRGDEKIAENMTYNQFVPYTDRLDYLAPLANNVAYVLAVERLAKLEMPPRCAAIRVLCCELARISSHLLGMGVYGMDTGAWTVFMHTFNQREKLYTLFEELTGARFTTSYTRIGGLARDLPTGWLGRVRDFAKQLYGAIDELDSLLSRNRIFWDRTVGVGVISKDDAIAHGLSGPNLRASGLGFDLRKDEPYSGYEQYDFDVPIGCNGDSYDRYAVRLEELRQSLRIVEQVVQSMPEGPWYAEEARDIFPPPKAKVMTRMEELIQNFMLTTQGPNIPAGQVYFEAENPKGALGFYIVSRGGGVPYRLKIRAPSFCSLSILSHLLPGLMMSDIPVILGSLDFVMGECDR